MYLRSRRVDIIKGLESDLERIKPLNTKGRERSTRNKQTVPLKGTKNKKQYNTRSRDISKQTQPGEEGLSSRKLKQSAPENSKSKGGEPNKLRTSARLEAQRPKKS
jgi:hypothetical protein